MSSTTCLVFRDEYGKRAARTDSTSQPEIDDGARFDSSEETAENAAANNAVAAVAASTTLEKSDGGVYHRTAASEVRKNREKKFAFAVFAVLARPLSFYRAMK